MIRRLGLAALAAGLAAVSLVLAQPASATTACPPGFHELWTGLYNPENGQPLYVCVPFH
jgi:hypothetical protein